MEEIRARGIQGITKRRRVPLVGVTVASMLGGYRGSPSTESKGYFATGFLFVWRDSDRPWS